MTNRSLVLITSTVLITTLAACGGGSGAAGVAYPGIPSPTNQATANPTPTTQPTASPTPTTQATANPTPTPTPTPAASAPLQTAMINGRITFVNSSRLPVYIYTSDTPGHSTCTNVGGCLPAWPAVSAPAGPLPAPFTSFTRSDNNQVQLQYNGQPLYTFVADSADTANGDGDVVGSGTFKLAHPIGD
jgi:predicted lipoprotein with Yx(FWY)xxD motif